MFSIRLRHRHEPTTSVPCARGVVPHVAAGKPGD